jgi:hypothetical protein
VELFIVLLIIAAGAWAYSAWSSNRRRQQERDASLASVRAAAAEDVTRLGEDVASLDAATAGRTLDEATMQDYRRSLDEYDSAKAALERMRSAEDARPVTEALEDGRYAVACVRARLEGEPIPVRRPPCFFNPQHGPSTEDVEWAPPGGLPRKVPVCAADAERVKAGAEPDTRKVLVGNQRRPYWEAGPAYSPWARGYFGNYAMSGLLPGVLLGAVLGSSFGGWGDGYAGDSGGSSDAGNGGDGGDSGDSGGDGSGDGGDGGGDYGGGDFGGGDSGGWGGGDFGGGDFGCGGDFGG